MKHLPLQFSVATAADGPFLWQCLAWAAHEKGVDAARSIPAVARYLDGWPRHGDFGIVASVETDHVGAAWARVFSTDDQPFVYVNSATPEIAIAVAPAWRGRGIGRALLAALIDSIPASVSGFCLNVREDNPSIKLYREFGFERMAGSDLVNRTGGRSFGMVWRRPSR